MSKQKFEFADYSAEYQDSNDVDFVSPNESKKSCRGRKSTAGLRKVNHEWKTEQVIRLIEAVKERHGLWNISSPDYKRIPKLEIWHDVMVELGVKGIDIREVKTKWSSLRVTFKANVGKMRRNELRHGTSDLSTVTWRYFKPMMFLETMKENMKIQASVNGGSISEDFRDSESSQAHYQPKQEPMTATDNPTSPRPSSPLTYTNPIIADATVLTSNEVTSMQSMDSNSTFCEYILSEIRTLPEDQARTLRRMLARTMFDFMDDYEAEQKLSQKHRIQ